MQSPEKLRAPDTQAHTSPYLAAATGSDAVSWWDVRRWGRVYLVVAIVALLGGMATAVAQRFTSPPRAVMTMPPTIPGIATATVATPTPLAAFTRIPNATLPVGILTPPSRTASPLMAPAVVTVVPTAALAVAPTTMPPVPSPTVVPPTPAPTATVVSTVMPVLVPPMPAPTATAVPPTVAPVLAPPTLPPPAKPTTAPPATVAPPSLPTSAPTRAAPAAGPPRIVAPPTAPAEPPVARPTSGGRAIGDDDDDDDKGGKRGKGNSDDDDKDKEKGKQK